MKEKDRNTLDELFRSKLYDFETDTVPGDWEAISGKLPEKAAVTPFRRIGRYWAAAAAIVLLLLTGGIYRFLSDNNYTEVTEVIQKETEKIRHQAETHPVADSRPTTLSEPDKPQMSTPQQTTVRIQPSLLARAVPQAETTSVTVSPITEQPASPTEEEKTKQAETVEADAVETKTEESIHSKNNIDKKSVTEKQASSKKTKRWGFGMGGGSISTGTSQILHTYALKGALMNKGEVMNEALLMHYNAPYFNEQTPRTNIRHKTPISVGLGVSYQLADRWALQSGLNYTLLSSKWESNTIYKGETTLHLHFIGVPLSLSYTIAEWRRFRVYASAGMMIEKNIAGRLKVEMFREEERLSTESTSVRMREWMWSTNARTGVSYPLLRFLSVYAEVGADYYFDNGSTFETIRSEKPFNVNLQAGFRFGF